jgi:hypothetical protein
MFGIVIKNTILVFMIIFIVYFLLNSRILEINQIKKIDISNKEKVKSDAVNKLPDTLKYPMMERSITADQNLKELYNFVYDDSDAPENLQAFYKEDIVSHKCVDNKDKALSCADESRQKSDSLCPSTITKHHELLDKKQVKNGGIVDVPQSCINEALAAYENENVMNGAELMNGLTGFNTFDTEFASL